MVGQGLVLTLIENLHIPWLSKATQYMGLYPYGDDLHIALFKKTDGGCSVISHEKIKDGFIVSEADALREYIKEHRLSQTPAILILPKQYYDIFMLDDFVGDGSDKHKSIKWRLAEYLEYPCEEAIVEYMTLPCKNHNQAKIYALAMRESHLRTCLSWARKNKIKLTKIDIWQNAIKNSILLETQDKGTVIVQLGEHKSELVIMRNNEIYFMRDIDISAEHFKTESPDALSSRYDTLSLEIQRSIDYCASNIRNPGITQVYINPGIKNVLNNQTLEGILGLPVKALDLPLKQAQTNLEMPQLISGSAALGGAT